jgi:formylglycine-generating enzyme
VRSALAELAYVYSKRSRPSKASRKKPVILRSESLEPRLALAVADRIAPAVRSITPPAAQTYAQGSTLSFTVNFTENVIVTGSPTLPLTIGGIVRQAAWNGRGSGSNALVFTTPVQSGDAAPNGVQIAGPIGLSAGTTIRDRAGNRLIAAASGTFPRVVVDAVGPSVIGHGSIAATPTLVSLAVTFTEPVVVTGKPTIPFTLAGTQRQLVYSSGTGSNVLVFAYRPSAGEVPTTANVALSTQAIALNGGAIADRFGNAARSLAKPMDVALSAVSLAENQPSGTTVGVLSTIDPDSRDTFTYSLVSGDGSTDNANFQIAGNRLLSASPFNFEAKSTYTVRVRSTDSGGLSTDKAFVITVTDVNEAPTSIALAASSIAENSGPNTVISTLTTTDPDRVGTFTYTLVSGSGSADNAVFNVFGSQLRATATLDFEMRNLYSVRIRSTDQGGLSTEKAFTITVTNVDDVVIEFVKVGDAGNEAEESGYGDVSYEYRIGKFEVTIGQYVKFLNAVAQADPYSLYSANMASIKSIAGITRSRTYGHFIYTVTGPLGVAPRGAESPDSRPIAQVSWFDAARFANWMSNGQPTGPQGPTTTENGAYNLNGAISGVAPALNAINPNTGSAPLYRIPSEDEWYKAAYYKGGGKSAGYWDYATKSNEPPGNTIGGGSNQANWYSDYNTRYSVTGTGSFSISQNYLTNVGAYSGSPSAYGTFDQTGNVSEWSAGGVLRGGYFGHQNSYFVSARYRQVFEPSVEFNVFGGFRLASPAGTL